MAIDRERRVQVVLGEAERTGILRFVLEGEGFDIVGMASTDEELERVLLGARPSVIVLDGGISVAAALEARDTRNRGLPGRRLAGRRRRGPRRGTRRPAPGHGGPRRGRAESVEAGGKPGRTHPDPEFLEVAPPSRSCLPSRHSALHLPVRTKANPGAGAPGQDPRSRAGGSSDVDVGSHGAHDDRLAVRTHSICSIRTGRHAAPPSPAQTQHPDDGTVATGSERPSETGKPARCGSSATRMSSRLVP